MTKKKICIVSDAIFEVPSDNETSIYYGKLALFLKQAGYDVTILLTDIDIKRYKKELVHLDVFCNTSNVNLFLIPSGNSSYFRNKSSENQVVSYKIYNWFKTQTKFDVIFFSDYRGYGFYSLLAKHQGLKFQDSKIMVKFFHPTRWKLSTQRMYFDSLSYITTDYMERKSIEMADVLLVTSNNIVNWLNDNKWNLPKKMYIIPDVGKDFIKIIEEPYPGLKSDMDLSVKPKVSVCLIHYERPYFLKYAIDSLRKQDYTNYEVILVDDCSKDEESIDYLNNLSEEFNNRGWKIIKQQENLYSGASRNRAAKEATGEYVIFMDDDDCFKPYTISTFVKAIINSKADVLTCFNEVFSTDFEPKKEDIQCMLVFTGDPALGIFENSFGQTSAIFKKNVFLETGGFIELKNVAYQDWEVFVKTVLKGYRLDVIPESLLYYRRPKNSKKNRRKSISDSFGVIHDNQIILKPYIDLFGPNIASVLIYVNNTEQLNEDLSSSRFLIKTLKDLLKNRFNTIINKLLFKNNKIRE